MERIQGNTGFCGQAVVAAILAVLAFSSDCLGAWSGMNGCYGPPYVISPLDMPLNPYAMPRRPAWGGSSFAYHVKPSPQCQLCGCGRGTDDASAACRTPYPPELAESFAPAAFERLGQIPHDLLLGPGQAVGPAAR